MGKKTISVLSGLLFFANIAVPSQVILACAGKDDLRPLSLVESNRAVNSSFSDNPTDILNNAGYRKMGGGYFYKDGGFLVHIDETGATKIMTAPHSLEKDKKVTFIDVFTDNEILIGLTLLKLVYDDGSSVAMTMDVESAGQLSPPGSEDRHMTVSLEQRLVELGFKEASPQSGIFTRDIGEGKAYIVCQNGEIAFIGRENGYVKKDARITACESSRITQFEGTSVETTRDVDIIRFRSEGFLTYTVNSAGLCKLEGVDLNVDIFDLDLPLTPEQAYVEAPNADGFVIGGVNSDETISRMRELTGLTIEEIESRAEPGPPPRSSAGFMGKQEITEKGFRGLLKEDNTFVVDESGRTHQELAALLFDIVNFIERVDSANFRFRYRGQILETVRFGVEAGDQASIFREADFRGKGGLMDNNDYIIYLIDPATGERMREPDPGDPEGRRTREVRLNFTRMVAMYIWRYGFYEGRGDDPANPSRYRTDPAQIMRVLNLKPNGPPILKARVPAPVTPNTSEDDNLEPIQALIEAILKPEEAQALMGRNEITLRPTLPVAAPLFKLQPQAMLTASWGQGISSQSHEDALAILTGLSDVWSTKVTNTHLAVVQAKGGILYHRFYLTVFDLRTRRPVRKLKKRRIESRGNATAVYLSNSHVASYFSKGFWNPQTYCGIVNLSTGHELQVDIPIMPIGEDNGLLTDTQFSFRYIYGGENYLTLVDLSGERPIVRRDGLSCGNHVPVIHPYYTAVYGGRHTYTLYDPHTGNIIGELSAFNAVIGDRLAASYWQGRRGEGSHIDIYDTATGNTSRIEMPSLGSGIELGLTGRYLIIGPTATRWLVEETGVDLIGALDKLLRGDIPVSETPHIIIDLSKGVVFRADCDNITETANHLILHQPHFGQTIVCDKETRIPVPGLSPVKGDAHGEDITNYHIIIEGLHRRTVCNMHTGNEVLSLPSDFRYKLIHGEGQRDYLWLMDYGPADIRCAFLLDGDTATLVYPEEKDLGRAGLPQAIFRSMALPRSGIMRIEGPATKAAREQI